MPVPVPHPYYNQLTNRCGVNCILEYVSVVVPLSDEFNSLYLWLRMLGYYHQFVLNTLNIERHKSRVDRIKGLCESSTLTSTNFLLILYYRRQKNPLNININLTTVCPAGIASVLNCELDIYCLWLGYFIRDFKSNYLKFRNSILFGIVTAILSGLGVF